MMQSGWKSRSRVVLVTAILVTLASSARAASSCPNQIASCGCVIAAAGEYKVTDPLAHSQNGPFCLEIDVAGVRLDLGGNSITDSPSPAPLPPVALDTGIHLTKRAINAIVVGGGATIRGFLSAGIEIEGSGAIISDLKADNNNNGINLTGAHNVQLMKIDASDNSGIGLSLSHSSKNQISNITADGNASFGIFVFGRSDFNQISNFQANSNGTTGVTVTPFNCPSDVSGPACFQRGGRGNSLTGGDASGNLFGIFLGDRTSATTVIGNNAAMNAQADLEDEASNCDHNVWFGNTFGVATPSSCIH